ncbi:hypothetical protein TRFO_34558 [Tritrichomonas foetus]|uniref:Uncharacterized protein n=1 Tax=Tritrichomonas foetus TaxID=1144522 RepID=A0A1J4JPA5_9EUKA|nr:hypothetical protein TRFO_34558 [Tritrichomonas foetus]|eukprot:OHS99108.1 hypothetical protein TRFO_34558 [Tritrichomonas foetus]
MMNKHDGIPLLWDQLKQHIQPAEVDMYARRIGLARITRNEEANSEKETLLQMQNAIQSDINEEIDRKNPSLLNTYQRQSAIERAIKFLDSLRQQGHFVDPDNPNDSQMIKYLKYAKTKRPNSYQISQQKRPLTPLSLKKEMDLNESIAEVQTLMDEEFSQLTKEINEIRVKLFSSCDELQEVKNLELPSTDSIEAFNKKLQTQEVVVKQMRNSARKSSSVARLRDAVHMNRAWE